MSFLEGDARTVRFDPGSYSRFFGHKRLIIKELSQAQAGFAVASTAIKLASEKVGDGQKASVLAVNRPGAGELPRIVVNKC